MAANILSVWNSDRAAMSRTAQAEAHRYSWDGSMEALFGTIYRKALGQQLAEVGDTREPARKPVRERLVAAE
jgi:hypothetical protein